MRLRIHTDGCKFDDYGGCDFWDSTEIKIFEL